MKLTTFNPIQDAIKSQSGFEGSAYRRFRTSLCWKCQKDKPRLQGKTSQTQGGSVAKAASDGAPRKFICGDCASLKKSAA